MFNFDFGAFQKNESFDFVKFVAIKNPILVKISSSKLSNMSFCNKALIFVTLKLLVKHKTKHRRTHNCQKLSDLVKYQFSPKNSLTPKQFITL